MKFKSWNVQPIIPSYYFSVVLRGHFVWYLSIYVSPYRPGIALVGLTGFSFWADMFYSFTFPFKNLTVAGIEPRVAPMIISAFRLFSNLQNCPVFSEKFLLKVATQYDVCYIPPENGQWRTREAKRKRMSKTDQEKYFADFPSPGKRVCLNFSLKNLNRYRF